MKIVKRRDSVIAIKTCSVQFLKTILASLSITHNIWKPDQTEKNQNIIVPLL